MSLWGVCPNFETINIFLPASMVLPVMGLARLRASQRHGPHNMDVLSIIIGSLLGDASAEHRAGSTRIRFQQEYSHAVYIQHLWSLLFKLGYCSALPPDIMTRKGSGDDEVRFVGRFSTFSFISFNWIWAGFYTDGVKGIPTWLPLYLTPLALAIWIMDDGCATGYGLKLATNSFTYEDCLLLCTILNDLYGLKVNPQKAGVPGQWHLYVHSESMEQLARIVKPCMHPCMYYKLGRYA